jgi:hypothetical protein
MAERVTGKTIRPWPQPRVKSPMNVIKMVAKISLGPKARGKVPKKVEVFLMRIEAPAITLHAFCQDELVQKCDREKGCTRPDHKEWAPWIEDTAVYLGS